MAKKVPLRQCLGCGEMKSKKELLRILKQEDGTFVLDATGKKNGRGAYICRDRECLNKAIKTKGLDRSFKETVSAESYEAIKKEFDNIETK